MPFLLWVQVATRIELDEVEAQRFLDPTSWGERSRKLRLFLGSA
jgi:hypothetical protein